MFHHDVRVAVKRGTKIAYQLLIHFDRDYATALARQLLGQDASAGADLDDEIVGRDRRPCDEASGERPAPQEVLGELFPPGPISFLGHG